MTTGAAPETPALHQVRLGGSSVRVTELSFGGAALGNLYTPVSDTAAYLAVEAAWKSGIRTFDTAPHYGLGLSERRLGDALRHRPRRDFTISTKVGRILEPLDSAAGDDLANGFAVPATHRRRWDFSAAGIERSLCESLERLALDCVDIVYLHDPDDFGDQVLREAYPALERLRDQGVVQAIGAGMNQAAMLTRIVRETDVDVVLLAGRYTLLDQSGLDELLPTAHAKDVSVVVGGVFNSGLLARPNRGATFDYAPVSEEMLTRATRMKEVCERYGVPLRAAALAFPFGHPAVSSVLIGARTPEEVRDAVAMAAEPVPQAVWTSLRDFGLLPDGVPTPASRQPAPALRPIPHHSEGC